MNIVKEVHLGSGTYGDVYKTIDRNNGNHVVALKAMKNGEDGDIREATIRELCNTQNIVHPNIISVDPLVYNDGSRHSVYINEDKGRIELSLEMMDGDINSIETDHLTSVVLRKMVYDVTKGLYHMHSMGYTHNDLKPDNILYKLEGGEYTFKLGDFGLSQYLGIPFPAEVTSFLSTASVKAPNSNNSSYYVKGNKYNYNSDMFSLGATMFWLCMNRYGVRWFDFRVSESEVFVDIRKQNFLEQAGRLEKMYGEDGYDFLVKCMAFKSSERMSSKKALEHPYLRPLRGGFIGDLVARLYKQPNMVEITKGNYELEFMDDMYNLYKDRRVNLYLDFETKTNGLLQKHMSVINAWMFELFDRFKMLSLESFLQYNINLIHLLNSKKIGLDKFQINGMCTFILCNKLLSGFASSNISVSDYMWATQNMFAADDIAETERDILRIFDGNIQITPVLFFLNYWYLKSIYTGERKKPNVNVLNTSIAAMLVILVSNSKPELENVKLDDLAKYCVKKALTLENYTDSANVSILSVSSDLESVLEICMVESNIFRANLELYSNAKKLLKL